MSSARLQDILASALRALTMKSCKGDTIPNIFLFSKEWVTSIDITE